MNTLNSRFQAVDILRALTMFLMIFVNDVGGVNHLPHWIDHVDADVDGMGFADTIFPAFLFIVGLSLPFAIQSRIKKGNSFLSILGYILLRSGALIVMGFFHVNSEGYSDAAILPEAVWKLLMTCSFFLIWLDYPAHFSRRWKQLLIGAGVLALLILAYLYKGGHGDHQHGMRHSWWGILGIIGWAYLVCAVLFLLLRGNLRVLTLVLLMLFGINVLSHMDLMPFQIWLIDDASSVSLIMMGTVASLVYVKWRNHQMTSLLLGFMGIALVLIVLGLYIRPFTGGISKINSTPSWVSICGGIALLAFALMIWLVELKGKGNWFNGIKAAGTSTLTCYLMPYLFYGFLELFDVWYPHFLNQGVIGVLRSFVLSFLLITLVRQLEKKKIRLRI